MVKRRGVTLMELIMVVGILSILFTVGAPMLMQVNRQFILSRSKVELQQEARGIMYVVTRALRQAQSDSIVISRANANQPFYSKISFTKEQGDTLIFQQEGTTLYQVIGGARRPLSRNLSYLAFTFSRSDDMGIISVAVTLRKAIYEGQTKSLHMASEKVRVMN